MTVTPETHAKIKKYSETHNNIPMSIIAEKCFDWGLRYDITKENWAEKTELDLSEVELWVSMKACNGRAKGENDDGKTVVSCVWFRDGKPPQIRILGRLELAVGRCAACERTELDEIRFEAQDQRIVELEKGLKSHARELYKIPVCEGGAHLTPDATGFERCRRSNISVDILRFCKVVDDGPCAFFKETVVGVGEKT